MLARQLVALLGGLILGLICAFGAVGGLSPVIIFFAPLWGLAFYAIPTLLGIFLLRALTGWLGKYEDFANLSGVFALAISFGLSYLNGLDRWITSRGELHGTILGAGPPPEDIGGQILIFGSLAAWIALMVFAARKWKHARLGVPQITPTEERRSAGWLWVEAILILAITVIFLDARLVARQKWSSPAAVEARELGVLNDKGALAGDRALALATIGRPRDAAEVQALQREVREETGQNQITAAVGLIGSDDQLALSVLEKPLMQGGMITGTMQPTTIHTPSDGFVKVTATGYLGTYDIGYSVQGVRDPATVPLLVRLMGSPGQGTREGAAGALRNILKLSPAGGNRWKPAWPPDIDLRAVEAAMIRALDDPAEKVRYFAVCTLMEATGNPHYPAVFLFQSDEQERLDEWKAWARTNGFAR